NVPAVNGEALYFVAPRRVELRHETLDPPGPGQLLVRSVVSAISAGTELLLYRGEAPRDLPADETITALGGTLEFPLKYGYSLVGRVVSLGPDVEPEWLGRRVFTFHPHERLFLTCPAELLPLPDDVAEEDAAL